MERSYETLSEAINSLKLDGYVEDFNLCDAGVENKHKKTIHNSDELIVITYYRFEGTTNPDDSSVLYVIETTSGEKGLLVDAYGMYSGNVSQELMDKLKMR
ncbi:phosphoribosylpyrophosphate synthetase [Zhouia spongiae]|uniref:Phosphoribosylpyrophosphate synthetase n=1 Tax=Zhouia spongiae TaxID=2202721 RepID=A0ABY3YIQ5_9FLAO|nr:phosphoribosylpyrophosphate synthetase [Zhouia spongiae]UNY97401.1 phosphoribosylpyrophosphate synthetase [Zhouia spongiae]